MLVLRFNFFVKRYVLVSDPQNCDQGEFGFVISCVIFSRFVGIAVITIGVRNLKVNFLFGRSQQISMENLRDVKEI